MYTCHFIIRRQFAGPRREVFLLNNIDSASFSFIFGLVIEYVLHL